MEIERRSIWSTVRPIRIGRPSCCAVRDGNFDLVEVDGPKA